MRVKLIGMLLITGAALCRPSTAIGQSEDNSRSGGVIAVINGRQSITWKEVDEAAGAQLVGLLEKVYGLRKKALDDLITKILLEDEAKTRGVTTELLKQELLPTAANVHQSQVDRFYAEHRDAFGTLGEEEAKQRVRMDMETRERLEAFKKAVQHLKTKARITTYLALPPAPVVSVDSTGPSKGPAGGSVTIVEFSDFQCPYCKTATATLEQVQRAYPDQVRLVFKHSPLPIHPEAFMAAQAAVCAEEQNKFWEYHDRLFSSSDFSRQALKSYANELKLDSKSFETCLESEASRTAVSKDLQEAKKIGVQGTPTFVINGRVMRGAISLEAFKAAIDQELAAQSTNTKGTQIPTIPTRNRN